MLLSELKMGSSGIIQTPLQLNSSIFRLMELGLVPKTRVEVLRSGHNGGLMQIIVRGSRLCLSSSEAKLFLVSECESF